MNTGVPTLSLQTLEFWPILPNFASLTISFQKLKFLFYPTKHWNSDFILPNIETLALSFQALEFILYPFEH